MGAGQSRSPALTLGGCPDEDHFPGSDPADAGGSAHESRFRDARKHLGGGSTYRAAAALAAAYLTMGAPRIVFDYIFPRPSHLNSFLDALDVSAETPVHVFTLWAPLEVVQRRERERVGRAPLGAAVEECWGEIATNQAGLGDFLDNSAVPAEEAARTICNSVARGAARLAGRPRGLLSNRSLQRTGPPEGR